MAVSSIAGENFIALAASNVSVFIWHLKHGILIILKFPLKVCLTTEWRCGHLC